MLVVRAAGLGGGGQDDPWGGGGGDLLICQHANTLHYDP